MSLKSSDATALKFDAAASNTKNNERTMHDVCTSVSTNVICNVKGLEEEDTHKKEERPDGETSPKEGNLGKGGQDGIAFIKISQEEEKKEVGYLRSAPMSS